MLSAVLDDPNRKSVQKGMANFENETSVHLICQKGESTQSALPEHLMVPCAIVIHKKMASIPSLENILSSHCTQAS